MKVKRVAIAFGVMVLIVLGGLYWESRRTTTDKQASQRDPETRLVTPGVDSDEWDVSPEATVSLESIEETSEDNDPLTIPGRVSGPDGTPAGGIRLQITILPLNPEKTRKLQKSNTGIPSPQLTREQSLEERRITREITTDKNGYFSLEHAPPGIYRAKSIDSDWLGQTDGNSIQASSSVTPIRFSVSRTATLVGHVVDSNDNPIANPRIRDTTGSREITGDNSGRFVLKKLKPDQPLNTIKISKPGYRPHHLSIQSAGPGKTRVDTFVLDKGTTLNVRAVDRSGGSVYDGRIILRRLDDKRIRPKPGWDAAPGGGAMKPLSDDGGVTFSQLQPGQVQLNLGFSRYITQPETVELQSGETVTETLSVWEGLPVSLRFVNEETGEVIHRVRPTITVYAAGDQELDPGFSVRDAGKEGEILGVLHPKAERITIQTNPPDFESQTFTFSQSDLPQLKIPLDPEDQTTTEPPGLLKLDLSRKGKFSWDAVTDIRAYVVNQQTGERLLKRTGHRRVFDEPLPLPEGNYLFFAAIRTEQSTHTVLEQLTIESRHPGQRTVTPRRAASVNGEVAGDGKDALTVGISLLTGDVPDSVYYPEPLRTTLEDGGEFTLDFIPPETALQLHVMSAGHHQPGGRTGKRVINKTLSVLSPGETRTLPAINLSATSRKPSR